jgi:hypothetical protein
MNLEELVRQNLELKHTVRRQYATIRELVKVINEERKLYRKKIPKLYSVLKSIDIEKMCSLNDFKFREIERKIRYDD